METGALPPCSCRRVPNYFCCCLLSAVASPVPLPSAASAVPKAVKQEKMHKVVKTMKRESDGAVPAVAAPPVKVSVAAIAASIPLVVPYTSCLHPTLFPIARNSIVEATATNGTSHYWGVVQQEWTSGDSEVRVALMADGSMRSVQVGGAVTVVCCERVFVCVQREDTDTLAYIAWWTGVGERGAGGLPMCPVVTLPQVRHVAHLPWALVGTVGVSAVLYILLALALALMVFPSIACPDLAFLTPQASFITAFVTHCTSSACWADAFADVLAPDSLFFLHP